MGVKLSSLRGLLHEDFELLFFDGCCVANLPKASTMAHLLLLAGFTLQFGL